VNPLYRIPQDIDPVSSIKGVPTGSRSPKVDRHPSAQAEKTTQESLKPLSPSNAQGPTSTEGTLTSPFHATPSHDTMNISLRSEPTAMPKMIPSSPQSFRLGAPSGLHTGKGSLVPSFRAQLRLFLRVVESLWDNPDFIQAGFHIGRFATAVVDSKAERENIRHSSLA
jgi:hypothetical protein